MNFESDKRIKVNGACKNKKWTAPLMEIPFTKCSNENGIVSNQGNV